MSPTHGKGSPRPDDDDDDGTAVHGRVAVTFRQPRRRYAPAAARSSSSTGRQSSVAVQKRCARTSQRFNERVIIIIIIIYEYARARITLARNVVTDDDRYAAGMPRSTPTAVYSVSRHERARVYKPYVCCWLRVYRRRRRRCPTTGRVLFCCRYNIMRV